MALYTTVTPESHYHQHNPLYSLDHETPVNNRIDVISNYTRHDDFSAIWDLDSIGIADSPIDTSDDDKAVEIFKDSIQYHHGRYHVRFPWKDDHPDLPTNQKLAVGRLKSV